MINLEHIKEQTYSKFSKSLDRTKDHYFDLLTVAILANPEISVDARLLVFDNVADMFYKFHNGLLGQYTELLNRVCGLVQCELDPQSACKNEDKL